MSLTLEALQANDGDCLLLHHEPGAGGARTLVLIDGGSAGIFRRVLKPRLDELRGNSRLDLRMVMVSHIDADHITGIVDMLREMKRQEDDGEETSWRIRSLWHNAFESLAGDRRAATESSAVSASLGGIPPVAGLDRTTEAVVASVKQGNELRNLATQLSVPLNRESDGALVVAPATGLRTIKVAAGLTFTVLGPSAAQLEELDAEWHKSKANHPANPEAQAADYLNRTVPNLSSIVVMVEAEAGGRTRRLLLTGDAGGDHVLTALANAGLSSEGKLHVDLLKVMHHGSNHSVDQNFFERITADHYVISGNGKHNIPHEDMLRWLSDARPQAAYDVHMTNRTGHHELGAMLDRFLAAEQQRPNHRYHFRGDEKLSLSVAF
jgi:beta-lactamase superfamily II metal-dependent hydrolase